MHGPFYRSPNCWKWWGFFCSQYRHRELVASIWQCEAHRCVCMVVPRWRSSCHRSQLDSVSLPQTEARRRWDRVSGQFWGSLGDYICEDQHHIHSQTCWGPICRALYRLRTLITVNHYWFQVELKFLCASATRNIVAARYRRRHHRRCCGCGHFSHYREKVQTYFPVLLLNNDIYSRRDINESSQVFRVNYCADSSKSLQIYHAHTHSVVSSSQLINSYIISNMGLLRVLMSRPVFMSTYGNMTMVYRPASPQRHYSLRPAFSLISEAHNFQLVLVLLPLLLTSSNRTWGDTTMLPMVA